MSVASHRHITSLITCKNCEVHQSDWLCTGTVSLYSPSLYCSISNSFYALKSSILYCVPCIIVQFYSIRQLKTIMKIIDICHSSACSGWKWSIFKLCMPQEDSWWVNKHKHIHQWHFILCISRKVLSLIVCHLEWVNLKISLSDWINSPNR